MPLNFSALDPKSERRISQMGPPSCNQFPSPIQWAWAVQPPRVHVFENRCPRVPVSTVPAGSQNTHSCGFVAAARRALILHFGFAGNWRCGNPASARGLVEETSDSARIPTITSPVISCCIRFRPLVPSSFKICANSGRLGFP